MRHDIARAKAWTCLAMGMSSRALRDRFATRAAFLAVDEADAAVDGAFERFRSSRDGSASNLSLTDLAALRSAPAGEAPRAVS